MLVCKVPIGTYYTHTQEKESTVVGNRCTRYLRTESFAASDNVGIIGDLKKNFFFSLWRYIGNYNAKLIFRACWLVGLYLFHVP